MSPIRCTQNPTMGEEWRRGWHPERMPPAEHPDRVLVGAGPAGLELARTLGHRGYEVAILERGRELGGRVRLEARLPGLSAWIRVIDYREHQLGKLDNVEIYRQSAVTVDDALEFGFPHIVVASGARWRADGVGRWNHRPIPIADGADVLTPDDILSGARPAGARVIVFDDDHYYMGGVLAELLTREGFTVTVVCPKPQVSGWTRNTLEVERIQARLLSAGVTLHVIHAVVEVGEHSVALRCAYTGLGSSLGADSVVLVTARVPNDSLYRDLLGRSDDWRDGGVQTVRRIGDAEAPSTIAAAVYSGHKCAREFGVPVDNPDDPALAIRREVTELSDDYTYRPTANPM